MLDLPAGATLNKLRLRGAPPDALRARLALERALQQVDWQPPALPAEAILLVRRLGVPAATAGPRWPQRVEQALREQLDHARRPWLQADVAQAASVLFNDETELLACLVRDWVQGSLEHHWWWRSVLGAQSPGPWLRQRVLARGERLLPVARRLARSTGNAAGAPSNGLPTDVLQHWFARLSAAEAAQAIAALEQAHAWPLPASPPPPSLGHARTQRAQAAAVAAVATQGARQPTAGIAKDPGMQRLLALVPELRGTPLLAPQRRLLALVLSLLRAPTQGRLPALASAIARLGQAEFDIPAVVPRPRTRSTGGPVEAPAGQGAVSTPFSADDGPASSLTARRATPVAEVSEGSEVSEVSEAFTSAAADPRETTRHATPQATLHPHADGSESGSATAHRAPRAARGSRHAHLAAQPDAAASVHTEFGGLFYLLNAALASGLYADFTAPRTPGLALSPWDWLAWVGRAWFGRRFKRDPLWSLLADLSGRRVWRHPTHGFKPPPDWSMPADWQALCAAVPAMQAAALALQCGPRQPTRWLQGLLACLQVRLGLALGLGLDDAAAVPGLLCRHAAMVQVDELALHVQLSLQDLPLAIRIAGLDRDAGWIPAAGRSLYFEFR